MKYWVALIFIASGCNLAKAQDIKPFGAVPTPAQLRWQSLQMIAIVHFGLNTFTHQEWGYGDVPPNIFQPQHFDAMQIVRAAKAAGIRGIILVAKHHDGFCLWPTKTTDYNIAASSWMNGKGDVVRAFADACREAQLAFGVYCSPWDRHSGDYGSYRYVELYRQQWKELATRYGPLFECWFDGANGGTGYYGGARENRVIDRSHYYGWDTTWAMIRQLQPGAVIFSDVGPDVRWVGNENGYAADSTWETFTPESPDANYPAPGHVQTQYLPYGTRMGKYWMPAECDVPLRPGWFYHPQDEGKQKTPEQLWEIYVHSVGRAGVMNLGLAPTPEGLLDTQDVQILQAFGEILRQTFAHNLASTAHLVANNIRAADTRRYGIAHLINKSDSLFWATDDSVSEAVLTLYWRRPQQFNLIQLKEYIRYGQRIDVVIVEIRTPQGWNTVATVHGIGANRLIELPDEVKTNALRIRMKPLSVSNMLPTGMFLNKIGVYRHVSISLPAHS
ncbi:MAG: alpha-L-fucosidase [Thermoflavifilum sp.]|nr:alpha-L-fucosidase [Thermoflavifilum sp.]